MPRGDRTGPIGRGPMTGRGAGFCGGYAMPGYTSQIPGRGFGMRFGGGRGRGWGRGWQAWGSFYAPGFPYPYENVPVRPTLDKESETKLLKVQAERMRESLEAIEKRLTELEQE
jgi:hypothetical protein